MGGVKLKAHFQAEVGVSFEWSIFWTKLEF